MFPLRRQLADRLRIFKTVTKCSSMLQPDASSISLRPKSSAHGPPSHRVPLRCVVLRNCTLTMSYNPSSVVILTSSEALRRPESPALPQLSSSHSPQGC